MEAVLDKGLLEMAAESGIDKPLMDVAVTPLGQGAGPAVRTSYMQKSKWGYPSGAGIHNVPSAWDWMRNYKKSVEKGGLGHSEAWPVADVGSNLIMLMAGGDFVLIGPIENASMAFPACAMCDIFMAEAAKDIGTDACRRTPILQTTINKKTYG